MSRLGTAAMLVADRAWMTNQRRKSDRLRLLPRRPTLLHLGLRIMTRMISGLGQACPNELPWPVVLPGRNLIVCPSGEHSSRVLACALSKDNFLWEASSLRPVSTLGTPQRAPFKKLAAPLRA